MKRFSRIFVILIIVTFSINAIVFAGTDNQKKTKENTVNSSHTESTHNSSKDKKKQSKEVAETEDNSLGKKLEQENGELRKESAQIKAQPFIVKYGMRGESVRTVQTILMELGFYADTVDGVFGNNTLNAVKDFQLAHKMIPDGIVGDATLAVMKRAEPIVNRNMRSFFMNASAYSAYDPGNSQYTSRGSFLRKGLVAVDPSFIPLGTRLYIPGYGYAIADDVGGSIKGNRIDLAFDSHREALEFGRRDVVVYIVD